MSAYSALSLSLEEFEDEWDGTQTIEKTDETTSDGEVKYQWVVTAPGGTPPYDVIVKSESGIILDSVWNAESEKIGGEFYADQSLEFVVVELVDNSGKTGSRTLHV